MIHSVVKDPTPWKLPNAQRRRELDNPIGGYEGMSVALCRHIGLGDQVCFDICKDDGTTLQAGVDVRSATFDIRFHCEGGVVSHRKKEKKSARLHTMAEKRAAAQNAKKQARRDANPQRIQTASLLHRGASGNIKKETSTQRSVRLIAETKGLIKSFRKMK